jgi:hypothetical protein
VCEFVQGILWVFRDSVCEQAGWGDYSHPEATGLEGRLIAKSSPGAAIFRLLRRDDRGMPSC